MFVSLSDESIWTYYCQFLGTRDSHKEFPEDIVNIYQRHSATCLVDIYTKCRALYQYDCQLL